MVRWQLAVEPELNASVERCVRPSLDALAAISPPAEVPEVALIVGVPGRVTMARLTEDRIPFIFLAAPPWPGPEVTRIAAARAECVLLLDSREVQSYSEVTTARQLLLAGMGAPRPSTRTGGVHAEIEGNRLIGTLLDQFPGLVNENPGIPAACLVGSGGIADLAAARCAWADGAYVVGLPGCGYPHELHATGALIAESMAEAEEAVHLIGPSAPLRRALVRRGQRALREMPSALRIAERLLEALVLGADATKVRH